jgi:hypothetical protein
MPDQQTPDRIAALEDSAAKGNPLDPEQTTELMNLRSQVEALESGDKTEEPTKDEAESPPLGEMQILPTESDNPKGLHQRYEVPKADGSPVDEDAVYFVLRLDSGGSDPPRCRGVYRVCFRGFDHGFARRGE